MKKYIWFMLLITLSMLFARESKNNSKLKQLGVKEEEDDIGINSVYQENYYFMEQEKNNRAYKNNSKSGLGVMPSKDLSKQLEINQYNINKTWKEIDPLNPPLQLEFDGNF